MQAPEEVGQALAAHPATPDPDACKERVVRVSCGMHLGLDQGVEVPEAALHEVVRGHLGETHLQKDLAELLSNLEEGVHATAVGWRARARWPWHDKARCRHV